MSETAFTLRPSRTSAQPRITCVVPALNESKNLQVLFPVLDALLGQWPGEHETILIDDGSTDDTPVWAGIWAQTPGHRYIQFSRNFGKEAALSAGLEAAQGDVVIFLDSDMQHPPELIEQMLERWRTGADSVYAVRASRHDEPKFKQWGSSLLYRILDQGGRFRIPPHAGDFRLMDRQVVDALLRLPERTRFMKGLYAWVGFQGEAIEYMPAERLHGQTHFNFWRLVRFALDGITAFSTWPLQILTLVGSLIALLSFTYGLYLVTEYLVLGNPVSGWTTLATSILFFSGINMLGLGVMGAYIARIFDEVKQRPLYVVRHDSGTPTTKVTS